MKQVKLITDGDFGRFKRLCVVLFIFCFTDVMTCNAQTGMHISPLFEGKILPSSQMIQTRIRGKAISKYKLSFFHSVRFKANQALIDRIDRLILDDFTSQKMQSDNQIPYSYAIQKTVNGRQSITKMYDLQPKGGVNRFLCYKVLGDVMTVIYLEGSVGSLAELRKILTD